MTTPVLGLNFGTHDAAAAVVHEGRVIAAVEEERLTRIKHTKVFPSHAINYCLAEAGLDPSDVDRVALFVDPRLQLLLTPANQWRGFPAALGSLASDLDKYRKRRRLPAIIRDSGVFRPEVRVIPVPHHRAHAASAYLTSPFDDALVVTLDGRGEYETACVYEGFLGFRPQRDEYKVMGLAAYGTPALVSRVIQLARLEECTGRLRLDLRYFDHHRRPSAARNLYSPRLVGLLGPPRNPDEDITDRHRDIAYAAQHLLEQLIGKFLTHARRLVPRRELCLAGGVALNCVTNGGLIESDCFSEVYVQPAAGDAGTSIGAALLADADSDRSRRFSLDHAFLGPEYRDLDIVPAVVDLGRRGYEVEVISQPSEEAAKLLHQGLMIGWFQGKVEFGPRALGARSILASATDAAVVDRINTLVKRREMFRPRAPAVLDEHAADYFLVHPAGRHVYPFMLATSRVMPGKHLIIPAVVHVDGSARVQTVSRAANPRFWSLIEAYRQLSGLPVVLNTSFNEADEPIVCSPQDAARSFISCGLDAFVIGQYLVRKTRKVQEQTGNGRVR